MSRAGVPRSPEEGRGIRALRLHLLLAVLLLLPGTGLLRRAEAGGRTLDGQMAPELSFPVAGLFGVTAGTRLSAYRGRPVFVKFWLRDCPICRRTLPRLQALHDEWGRRGLVVLSVVHKYRPEEVAPLMRRLGYDFPVACDLDGTQAKKFGVGRRPADYLIGIDGRVRESNRVTGRALARELGRYRLARVDPLPEVLREARTAVWEGRLGPALRVAEPLAGGKAAGPDLRAGAERIRVLARADLEGVGDWTRRLVRRRRPREARAVARRTRADYAGTSLAERAAAILRALTAPPKKR